MVQVSLQIAKWCVCVCVLVGRWGGGGGWGGVVYMHVITQGVKGFKYNILPVGVVNFTGVLSGPRPAAVLADTLHSYAVPGTRLASSN